VPDAHLQKVGDVGHKVGQIGLVQIMTSIHAHPQRARKSGGTTERHGCLSARSPVGHGIGLGVQFDAIRAGRLSGHDVIRVRGHEKAGANARPAQRVHDCGQHFHGCARFPSGLAGLHVRRIGHEGHLVGPYLQHQIEKLGTGKTLHIEFRVHHGAQTAYVCIRDVPGIGSRVDRDTMRAPFLEAHCCLKHIGDGTSARIAQGGDFVHIDAESSHPYLSETFATVRSVCEGQIYAMYAQRLMNQVLPNAKPADSVDRVLGMMDSFKVRHLPLVDGDQWVGLLYEDSLLEQDGGAEVGALHLAVPMQVAPHAHLYDLVAQFVRAEVDVLPVVREGIFLGSIVRGQILQFLADDASWGSPGGTVVVEVAENDLSLSEMARLVEMEGARILACSQARVPETSLIEVTFKLNTQDVEPVLSTLQRFGYHIQTFFHSPELEEEMRVRFEAFMRYLDL
jgi:acetoin utilization protein AcuB